MDAADDQLKNLNIRTVPGEFNLADDLTEGKASHEIEKLNCEVAKDRDEG